MALFPALESPDNQYNNTFDSFVSPSTPSLFPALLNAPMQLSQLVKLSSAPSQRIGSKSQVWFANIDVRAGLMLPDV